VNGDTALHLAVKERNQEMIYILKQFDFEKKSKLTRVRKYFYKTHTNRITKN
jgi:hypothetical protein